MIIVYKHKIKYVRKHDQFKYFIVTQHSNLNKFQNRICTFLYFNHHPSNSFQTSGAFPGNLHFIISHFIVSSQINIAKGQIF